MATVRYLVTDVERSIAFYTEALGFKLMSLADQVNAKMPDFTGAAPVNQFRENH